MKKILAILSVCLCFAFAKPYEALNQPLANEEKSLIEVFSFMCIHCYNHHKFNTLDKIKTQVPNLNYKIYPYKNITFGEEFAKLYAYAQGKDEEAGLAFTDTNSLTYKLSDLYFTAFFEKKMQWSSSKDFYALGLSLLNISQNELESFIQSPKGKPIYQSYDELSAAVKQYGGTPTFILKGDTLLLMQKINSLQELVDQIKSLAK